MANIQIEPPAPQDKAAWEALFLGYRRFYEMPDDPDIIERVWGWINDPSHQTECLLARDAGGEPIGLAHFRGPYEQKYKNPMPGNSAPAFYKGKIFATNQRTNQIMVAGPWSQFCTISHPKVDYTVEDPFLYFDTRGNIH